VIVNLGDGIPVTAMGFTTGAVGVKNALIGIGVFRLKPGKERGTEIEAGPFEIIDDLDDPALGIQGAGAGVGMVTFVMDALVPVVKGSGAILLFDLFDPGIFSRRLIKMPVKADTNFFSHDDEFPLYPDLFIT